MVQRILTHPAPRSGVILQAPTAGAVIPLVEAELSLSGLPTAIPSILALPSLP